MFLFGVFSPFLLAKAKEKGEVFSFYPAWLEVGAGFLSQFAEGEESQWGVGGGGELGYRREIFFKYSWQFLFAEYEREEAFQAASETAIGMSFPLFSGLFSPYLSSGNLWLRVEHPFLDLRYESFYVGMGARGEWQITSWLWVKFDVALRFLLGWRGGGEIYHWTEVKVYLERELEPTVGVKLRLPFYFLLKNWGEGQVLFFFAFHYEWQRWKKKKETGVSSLFTSPVEVSSYLWVVGLELRV